MALIDGKAGAPAEGPTAAGGAGRGVRRVRRHAALRSILALILREVSTRFGRTPGGYIWVLLQPLGMIVLLSVAFSLLASNPPLGTSFMLFKGTGFLILTIFRTLSQMIGMSLQFSRPLLAYPGVIWIDTLLARLLLNTLTTVMVTIIILSFIILFDGVQPMISWGPLALAIVLAVMLSFGVGCLNCVLFMRFEVWQQTWSILTAPLFVISGVIFLFEGLPPLGQQILWYNPIYHITGLIREGFYPVYSPTYISVAYVMACALVPMVLGLLLLRRFHRVLLER